MGLNLTIGALLIAGVAGAAGFGLSQTLSQPRVETEVHCKSAVGTISCELEDGWTVSVPRDVEWTAQDGTDHEGDRPDCLPPSGRGLEGPVTLAWIPVELDGHGWREVVWVGC